MARTELANAHDENPMMMGLRELSAEKCPFWILVAAAGVGVG